MDQSGAPADNGSMRSSDSHSSSYAEQKERLLVMQKIFETKALLKQMNESRTAEVDKFVAATKKAETALGLVENPQIHRLKNSFDRQNRRHMQEVDSLQKKLVEYEETLNLMDRGEYEPAVHTRSQQLSASLRRTGASIISAPLEIANKLKNAFGSADDVNVNEGGGDPSGRIGMSTFYTAKRRSTSGVSKAGSSKSGSLGRTSFTLPTESVPEPITLEPSFEVTPSAANPPEPLEDKENEKTGDGSSSHSGSVDGSTSNTNNVTNGDVQFPMAPQTFTTPVDHMDLLLQLNEQNKAYCNYINILEEKYERLAKDVRSQIGYSNNNLDEERFKITVCDTDPRLDDILSSELQKLEDMLNDTIDLHQAEFESLKEQNDIATRIDYQHAERLQNVEEKMESLQNHMKRLEDSLKEAMEEKVPPALWGSAALSVANILVEALKIILYIVATTMDFLRPLTGSRNRAAALLISLIAFFLFGHHIYKLNPLLWFGSKPAVNATTSSEL